MHRLVRQARRAAVSSFTFMVALGRARQRLPLSPAMKASALADVFGELCAVHGVRTVVSGHVPPEPAILVANHVSYLDPMVIAPQAPCLPVCKQEVSEWPVIGLGGRVLGVMYHDRSEPYSGVRVLRQAMRYLEAGISVLNFPEGTTTDGTHILPFQRGIFGIARLTGAPVVPVALRFHDPALAWTGNENFVPHYLRTAARPTSTAYVHVCEPIRCGPYDAPSAVARLARERIAQVVLPKEELHVPAERARVPAPRPDAVLSPASP